MSEKPVVIITGGAGYIGQELSGLFGADGYAVVVADLRADDAVRTADALTSDGVEAIGVGVDVTDEASARAMASAVHRAFGRIDVLVNNAGLFGNPVWTGPMLAIELAEWDSVMAVNVKGPLVCARAVAPYMREAHWGRIINVSSHGAYQPRGVYATSKLAVHQVTWNLAVELGSDNITVNTVAPGTIDVPTAHRNRSAEAVRASVAGYIVKRLGTPRDIYGAMKYFASQDADYCTGQTLMVNGGSNVRL